MNKHLISEYTNVKSTQRKGSTMQALALNRLMSQRGLAIVEALPLLFVFLILLSFGLGSFGVIHTAILNSIAARTYAFETFRHRSNLNYFRDARQEKISTYVDTANRLHGVQSDMMVGRTDDAFWATERTVSMGLGQKLYLEKSRSDIATHNSVLPGSGLAEKKKISEQGQGKLEANPTWVILEYGICLNSRCGD